MGRDVDGFCTILREAGHRVLTAGIVTPRPRIDDLPKDVAAEVADLYRKLGGRKEPESLKPGARDVFVDGVLVELDEQLHFNRYRALTLQARSYNGISRFPLAAYRSFCTTREDACLKHGRGQGRWTNPSTEAHFGPASSRGDLAGNGSPRWKQRAVYDLMKDLTQLNPGAAPLARIAIWDPLPGLPGRTVEDVVNRPSAQGSVDGLRTLISERSGCKL
jgi:hypothetical protein